MRHQIIGFTLGLLLLIIGLAGLVPAFLDFNEGHNNAYDFLGCSIVSIFFGGALVTANQARQHTLDLKQTFMLTTLSWLFISFFAALPLYYSDLDISFTDAFFESASGITTTGSTVLSGLDDMSRGILLWRSIIQWIGGIGIIAFAIVILPFLRIGGMQLFRTESSDQSEKIMPKTISLVGSIVSIYCLLTALCTLTYMLFGMEGFEAINHAMTTIPTGGYSTHDASFGFYDSAALHYAASFFMLAGAVPFVLFVKFLYQGKFTFFQDEQFRIFIFLLIGLISLMSVWLWCHSDYSLMKSLQHSTFNIISMISTTGFATMDYTQWGGFAAAFFFFITFLGSCSGSTAGGIKIIRLIIVTKLLKLQIQRLIHPHGVFSMRYQDKPIEINVAMNVMGFLGLYVVSNVALTVILSFLGLDFETSISAAATALANVGPGIGDVIGPSGNFSTLPDTAKWLLSCAMILGRLEIMTIFVLFARTYWQD